MKKIISMMCLMLVMGCSNSNTNVSQTSVPTSTPGSSVEPTSQSLALPKILAIGDSITEGTDLSSYPANLQDLVGDKMEVINFGVSGSSAQDSAEFPYRSTDSYQHSLNQDNVTDIIIMFGTNDTSLNSWSSREAFKESYVDLVDDYIEKYPNSNVYLCTISQAFYLEGHAPGVAEYGIQPDNVVIVNEVINEVANELNLTLIDVFSLTNVNNPWFFDDGIHPNAVGNVGIANLVYQSITRD